MGGGLIDWLAFDWQSFSTLMTGGLAVLAAYLVGRRQTTIQHRQADIQEAALRSDLFDRRYKVFERAEQFIREILQRADDPDPETQRDFVVAMGESRFLFKPQVRDGLEEIYRKWAEFHALKVTMKHIYETEGHDGEGNPESESVVFTWFGDRFTKLPELFHELRLGISQPPH